MKLILCPTDFSKGSENAVLYAAAMARVYKSKLLLMHCYETPVIYTDVTISSVQIDYQVMYENSIKALKKFYAKIADKLKGVPVELIIQQGLPSARTLEIAIEKKVDAIFLSSTTTSTVERFLIGSNTGRILKEATCPIMIIPPKAKFTDFNKIVYTTDLTEENLLKSEKVVDLAKMFRAEMIFLNVDNHFLVHDEKDLERITTRIKQFVKYPKMRGYVCSDANIADGITFFLKSEKVDCLAMATHHRNFLESIINPSITKRVAYKTDLPMFVINVD
jgi:nucleotide-binding universal stress UspA family protein